MDRAELQQYNDSKVVMFCYDKIIQEQKNNTQNCTGNTVVNINNI